MGDYPAFGKIPRLHRDVVITEKIDGTNGLIQVSEVPSAPPYAWLKLAPGTFEVRGVGDNPTLAVRAGSRNRWLTPESDNFGFSSWARDHAHDLVGLGVGLHYGEWWGKGINRGYGVDDKRFSLFNVSRWDNNDERPECCGVVPVLAVRAASELNEAVSLELALLDAFGSKAAPGFKQPEGIVIFHTAANSLFKVTLQGDAKPSLVEVGKKKLREAELAFDLSDEENVRVELVAA